MIGKLALLCGAVSLAFVPQPAEIVTPHVDYPLVKQVMCAGASGTAFRVGETSFLSVAHVTDNPLCTIDGVPIAAKQDGELDFATVEAALPKQGAFKIDCGGFVPGQYYWAVGYAGGLPTQTTLSVYATYAVNGGKRILLGYPAFIPGMSGGPVFGADGRVVGLVNAYFPGTPISISLELKATSLCRNA